MRRQNNAQQCNEFMFRFSKRFLCNKKKSQILALSTALYPARSVTYESVFDSKITWFFYGSHA